MHHYPRQNLAARFVARLMSAQGIPITSLLFSAPRSTGKTTFIREDLRPALEKNGALVIYADLWNNKTANPSAVIAQAILEKLDEQKTKEFSRVGNFEVTVAGIGAGVCDNDKKTINLTLSEVLSELSGKTKKKIILIIDEFQHNLTTPEGESTLFALKAALDEVNSSRHHGMVVLGVGSNRDKLVAMRNNKEQAFYLTHLSNLPFLDQKFTNWLIARSGLELDPDVVFDLFVRSGCKPDIINGAVAELQLIFDTPENPTMALTSIVGRILNEDIENQTKKINALPTTQWSVLGVMASDAKKTGLQTKDTCLACEKLSLTRGESVKFDNSVVQAAITALHKKKLIWTEARGVYNIEDEQVVSIMKNIIEKNHTQSSKKSNNPEDSVRDQIISLAKKHGLFGEADRGERMAYAITRLADNDQPQDQARRSLIRLRKIGVISQKDGHNWLLRLHDEEEIQ